MDEPVMNTSPETESVSRRDFLKSTGAVLAAAYVVPRHVAGGVGYQAPSDTLNIACVGCGGKGHTDVNGVSSENIVALCDVDAVRASETFKEFPSVPKYTDWRRMLDQVQGIDAVTVTTPDHSHAIIALSAMQLGKHVFVQKPLTHTIQEARKLTLTAREAGVATQMGNQGHSWEGNRLICEWVWGGAIGPVREAHAWTNRPRGYWPQGAHITRPAEIPAVPSTINWDVWVGPAPYRPYHPAYAPHDWRGWWDFGCGAIGDMACHIMDTPVWALKLRNPDTVHAYSTPFNGQTYPLASVVHYEFSARDDMPPAKLTWYDGGMMPERPPELEPGRMMGDQDGGVLLVGDKGSIMCGCYGRNPRLIPESKMQDFQPPPKTIPRSPGIYQGWIEAAKTGGQASSNFDYAGPLTEIALLGNVAIRFQDRNMKLKWNGENMQVTNLPEANEWMARQNEYRPGWSL